MMLAFYIQDTEGKGTYPFRRAKVIAESLPDTIEIIFILKKGSYPAPEGFKTITFKNSSELLGILEKTRPNLLVRDSGSTTQEEVDKIRKIVPSIIHFDDFGGGGEFADLVIQTLYTETNDKPHEHYVIGPESFIADEQVVFI